MTITESVILDPAEVDPTREEVDLSAVLDVSGIEWGEAGLVAQTVETKWGEQQIDYRVPGRTVTIPLVPKDVDAEAVVYETIYSQLLNKVAVWQSEGGSIKRVLSDGRTLFLDCYGGQFMPGDQWMAAHRRVEPGVKFTITAQPDFYGAERDVAFSQDANGTVSVTGDVGGDYPARTRVLLSDTSNHAQRGLLAGLRSRYYSADSKAAVHYEAEAMTAAGTAASFAVAGASGGNVMRRTDVGTSWTDMFDTRVGGNDLIHAGAYRVIARCLTNDTGVHEVRFQWGIGDLTLAETNDAVTMPVANSPVLIDLGQVLLYPLPIGSHKWRGKVQAKASAAAKTFWVDELWFINVDEGWCYVETETVGDAVLTALGACELRSDGAYRAGTRYGRLPDALGDNLRLPPKLEGRSLEIALRSTRGRLNAEADAGIDIVHVDSIKVRPCWVQVPDS